MARPIRPVGCWIRPRFWGDLDPRIFLWLRQSRMALRHNVLNLSVRSFVRPFQIYEHDILKKWTDFSANWHKWYLKQRHQTFKFEVRRSKVKVTRARGISLDRLGSKSFSSLKLRHTTTGSYLKGINNEFSLTEIIGRRFSGTRAE